jgi:hypothetical protein
MTVAAVAARPFRKSRREDALVRTVVLLMHAATFLAAGRRYLTAWSDDTQYTVYVNPMDDSAAHMARLEVHLPWTESLDSCCTSAV